jgi:hypothetical protein
LPERTWPGKDGRSPTIAFAEIRLGDKLFALYQGTTSVVPPPAKMVRALALLPQNLHEISTEKGAGAKAPFFCVIYGTTKVVP